MTGIAGYGQPQHAMAFGEPIRTVHIPTAQPAPASLSREDVTKQLAELGDEPPQ